jgi:hypothetical protein
MNYYYFGDLSPATPAQGMNVVLVLPCAAQATTFSDLIRDTCRLAREHNFMSLRSRLVSLVFFNKSAATHFLARNLAGAEVTTLNNEANLIDLSVFLPQRNASMVNKECATDLASRSESSMDVANIHKSKTNIPIARIGTMAHA